MSHSTAAVTLGVMEIPERDTVAAIHQAISLGYRAFDAAPIYGNEAAVGEAIRTAAVDRSELSVTTKLWNSSHGTDAALAAFDRTMARLQLERVDLYLIHWPVPTRGLYVETWKALVRLKEEGRAKAIGVSNFLPEHIAAIVDATGVVPAVNQIEVNPGFQQAALVDYHKQLGIVTEAWSPFGHGASLGDRVIAGIARRHFRSPAQVILKWHVQRGIRPVAKASRPGHMRENLALDDFALDPEDMAKVAALDRNAGCFGFDPRTFVAPEGMEAFCP